MINVISIGSDRNLFIEGSAVRDRQIEYGRLFKELHIVVFTIENLFFPANLPAKIQIAPNVWVYSTQSFSKFLHIKQASKVAGRIIKDRKFLPENTVVTVQDPFESGLVGLRLKKAFGLGLQIQIHTDFLSPYFVKQSLLNRLRVRMAKKVLAQADAVRAVNKKTIEGLSSVISLKPAVAPEVLPIFVDIKKIEALPINLNLKKRYPQFNFIILMASRLTKEKNISLGIETLQKLLKTHPRTGLLIVGSGPEQYNLKRRVEFLNLDKSVVFEPWQEDIYSYYKTADLFLLTSNYEGYGLTLIESVACHCPVVSTDVGIARELLIGDRASDPAFVCPIGDMTALFKSVSKIIEDPVTRELSVNEAYGRLGKVVVRSQEIYLGQYKNNLESAII